jgi:hypothetical protein
VPDVPRRLLVRLGSEEAAEAVLRDAHKLRSSSDTRRIFINPDLSPAAATLAYEARKKRREWKLKQQQPNSRVMETVHDVDVEVNFPLLVTRMSSPCAADSFKTVKTVEFESGSFLQPSTDVNLGNELALQQPLTVVNAGKVLVATAAVFVPASGRPAELGGN